MVNLSLFSTLLSISLIKQLLADCSVVQLCDDFTNNDCLPRPPQNEEERTPKIHDYGDTPFICDEFNGPNCCDQLSNELMTKNFKQIDMVFGSAGNGCDLCAANMKRFWCAYSCSPNQTHFLQLDGYIKIVDPLNPSGPLLNVSNQYLSVGPQTVCDMWQSCSSIPYATQVSAMSTPAGFMQFQGSNSVSQAGCFINIQYVADENKSITFNDVHQCQQSVPQGGLVDKYGFYIAEQCTCNSCSALCANSLYVPPTVLEGFNTWLIVSVYCAIVLVTVIVIALKRYRNSKKYNQINNNQESNPNPEYTYYRDTETAENNQQQIEEKNQ